MTKSTGFIAFIIRTLLQVCRTSDENVERTHNRDSPSAERPSGPETLRQKLEERAYRNRSQSPTPQGNDPAASLIEIINDPKALDSKGA